MHRRPSGCSLRRVTHTKADRADSYDAQAATLDLTSAAGKAHQQHFGADLKVDGGNVTNTGKRFKSGGHPASMRMGP